MITTRSPRSLPDTLCILLLLATFSAISSAASQSTSTPTLPKPETRGQSVHVTATPRAATN
ncbi:hypothetical protein, partial [Geminisphaera colitermitum]|uniref:hypothetical protein n=1 Tax=Geminisphaera colitermitum TaxID=1148786 RepID=UPI0005BBA0C4